MTTVEMVGTRGDFGRLWLGNAITEFGSQVTMTALPLIAVGVLHASGLEMGLLQAFYTLPFLVLALPAGVWLDRRTRRPVMITMDLARGALVVTIPVAAWLDALTWPHLYVVALAGGSLTLLSQIAAAAYLPTLVSAEELPVAHSRLNANLAVSGTCGPGLTGVLAGVVGAATTLVLDSATYLTSALLLSTQTHREAAPRRPEHRDLWREVREGWSAVYGNAPVRCLALHAAVYSGALQIAMIASVFYLLGDLRLSTGWYGLVVAAGGVGGIVGTLLAPRLVEAWGYGRALPAGLLPATAPFLLVPAAETATATAALSGAAFFLVGAGSCVVGTTAMTLRHVVTPRPLHARMNASYRLLPLAATPAGALVAGVLVDLIGARVTLWGCSALLLASVLPALARPVRTLRHVAGD
ncbi:MFS transporter [Nonomuraea sp. NPDC004186]